MTFTLV